MSAARLGRRPRTGSATWRQVAPAGSRPGWLKAWRNAPLIRHRSEDNGEYDDEGVPTARE
jgi:hypothetical protein